MFDDPRSLVMVLLRFSHIVFALVWMGHLYFFNLVNVPFQKDLAADLKPKINPGLLLRALWWFRWGAMYTVIFGWLLFFYKYVQLKLLFDSQGSLSNGGLWMLCGGLLGTIMWFNVWFLIWPRQKKILGGVLAGQPHPDAAKLGAQALMVSRFNTYASGPLLFFMIVPNNFNGWSPSAILLCIVVGTGFWYGLIKRSFKVKATV